MTKSEEIIEDYHNALEVFWNEYPDKEENMTMKEIINFLLDEIEKNKLPIC